MLAGSDDAIPWADRVLEGSAVAGTTVLLEALITKGTALQSHGRATEAEVLLRGAADVADATAATSGPNLSAALRARNNLRVQVMQVDLRESLRLASELFDIAERYGQRTFMIHALGAMQDSAFHTGDWDAHFDETETEFADAPDFYQNWFASQRAWRDAFRSDPQEAQRVVDAIAESALSVSSAQSQTWYRWIRADALTSQGRFDEAWASAQAAWGSGSENERAYAAGLFAAAGAGDPARVEVARATWRKQRTGEESPLMRAYERSADALLATFGGRWDDARAAYLVAVRTFDEIGDAVDTARLQLAIGVLAEGRFAEAGSGLDAARAWFAERRALPHVERYLANAVRKDAEKAPGSASRAGPFRSAPVRATR
jgi:hypothetical protein